MPFNWYQTEAMWICTLGILQLIKIAESLWIHTSEDILRYYAFPETFQKSLNNTRPPETWMVFILAVALLLQVVMLFRGDVIFLLLKLFWNIEFHPDNVLYRGKLRQEKFSSEKRSEISWKTPHFYLTKFHPCLKFCYCPYRFKCCAQQYSNEVSFLSAVSF